MGAARREVFDAAAHFGHLPLIGPRLRHLARSQVRDIKRHPDREALHWLALTQKSHADRAMSRPHPRNGASHTTEHVLEVEDLRQPAARHALEPCAALRKVGDRAGLTAGRQHDAGWPMDWSTGMSALVRPVWHSWKISSNLGSMHDEKLKSRDVMKN